MVLRRPGSLSVTVAGSPSARHPVRPHGMALRASSSVALGRLFPHRDGTPWRGGPTVAPDLLGLEARFPRSGGGHELALLPARLHLRRLRGGRQRLAALRLGTSLMREDQDGGTTYTRPRGLAHMMKVPKRSLLELGVIMIGS